MNHNSNLPNWAASFLTLQSDNITSDVRQIIDASQKQAFQAVNVALLLRNWMIGYRIAKEEMKGEGRAEYGAEVMKSLAKELTSVYGKGFTKTY